MHALVCNYDIETRRSALSGGLPPHVFMAKLGVGHSDFFTPAEARALAAALNAAADELDPAGASQAIPLDVFPRNVARLPKQPPRNLEPGLYVFHHVRGAVCLGAVGLLADGSPWHAKTTSEPSTVSLVAGDAWQSIEAVSRIDVTLTP